MWHCAAGELLDTLPPGIDEAVAISKVVQFLKSPEYSHFEHIVFDTAPTGHTLRLLTLPDFLDKTIGEAHLHHVSALVCFCALTLQLACVYMSTSFFTCLHVLT